MRACVCQRERERERERRHDIQTNAQYSRGGARMAKTWRRLGIQTGRSKQVMWCVVDLEFAIWNIVKHLVHTMRSKR